jgi:hypothetical protein
METVFEEIVFVIFVIAVYVALPAGIIAGWIRWLNSVVNRLICLLMYNFRLGDKPGTTLFPALSAFRGTNLKCPRSL